MFRWNWCFEGGGIHMTYLFVIDRSFLGLCRLKAGVNHLEHLQWFKPGTWGIWQSSECPWVMFDLCNTEIAQEVDTMPYAFFYSHISSLVYYKLKVMKWMGYQWECKYRVRQLKAHLNCHSAEVEVVKSLYFFISTVFVRKRLARFFQAVWHLFHQDIGRREPK